MAHFAPEHWPSLLRKTQTLNTNGSFTYRTATGYSGSDAFNYKASDGNSSSSAATVTITVKGVENPPEEAGEYSFGLNSGNNTYNQLSGVINAMRFQNDAGTGRMNNIQVLFNDTTPAGRVRLGVYSDNDGAPGSLLLDAGEVNASNGWVTISGLDMPVSQDTYYWLAFNLGSTNGVRYQSGQPGSSHYRVSYPYGVLPRQYPSGGLTNSNQFVMRVAVNVGENDTIPEVIEGSFGLDEGNNVYNQLSGVINAMKFQNNTGTGNLNELQVLFEDTTPNGKVRLGVYADNNDAPGRLLLNAGEVNVSNGWVTISDLDMTVSQGTYYWLAFNLESTNGVRYQSGQPTNSHRWINNEYGSMPNPFPDGPSDNDNQYVVRATVTMY